MYKLFVGVLVFFVGVGGVQARSIFHPEYDELDDPGPSAHTISVQTGTFYIKKLGQRLNPGTNYVFEKESDSAIGLEYLFHFNDSHAIGAQLFHVATDYTSTFAGGQYQMETQLVMFTYKGHIRMASWVRPFIHFSGGTAFAKLNEPGTDDFIGLAFGVGGGLYFPFTDHIGLTAEYRYLGGRVVDDADNEIDLESDAIFAGLNIIF